MPDTTPIYGFPFPEDTDPVDVPGDVEALALAAETLLASAFITGLGAWTSYTPTLVQSGAVTKTVAGGAYIKIGRLVIARINLAVTGSGTAANEVRIGLPVAAVAAGAQPCGAGFIFDSSTGLAYKGLAVIDNVNYVCLLAMNTTTGGRLGADTFTAALANADSVTAFVVYQSAA